MADINQILKACTAHGEKSEPDMEVGDLQQLVKDLWAILTPAQRASFQGRIIDWDDFVRDWLG